MARIQPFWSLNANLSLFCFVFVIFNFYSFETEYHRVAQGDLKLGNLLP